MEFCLSAADGMTDVNSGESHSNHAAASDERHVARGMCAADVISSTGIDGTTVATIRPATQRAAVAV